MADTSRPEWIGAEWPAPPHVRAVTSLRCGGVSEPPFDSLNLGAHVGDDPRAVAENRRRLAAVLELPEEPRWLNQVHGTGTAPAEDVVPGCEADAAFTDRPGVVCVVLTADCLPVLLSDPEGTRVAAVHAGWRGLLDGVIEAAAHRLGGRLHAWLGPAIGPAAFEVGDEVRSAFVAKDPGATHCFRPQGDRWLADIYALARGRLERVGAHVYGGGHCTYSEPERFFSYRRDGRTGRMASLIWMTR